MARGLPPTNHHAVGVVLGAVGLLIEGPSGSGKSSLGLALLDGFTATGRLARLVADDQILLEANHGRLLGRVPEAIAGLAEIHGFGIVRRPFLRAMVVDGMVGLVDRPVARMPEPHVEHRLGIPLPAIAIAAGDPAAALRIALSFAATLEAGAASEGRAPATNL